MSILNKLKAVNTRKSSRLFEAHPLAGATFEFRLQYLAAVAFAIAVEREPNANEVTAFNELANALAIEESDAKEQLSERTQLSGEDIETLLNAIKANNAASFYLLDMLWIHNIDGDCEEHETAISNELAAFFEINESQAETLRDLTQAIQNKTLGKNLPVVAKMWAFEELRNPLTPAINKLLPFRAVIDNRWIEHDDDTATDTQTGLTWFRRNVIDTAQKIKETPPKGGGFMGAFTSILERTDAFKMRTLLLTLKLDENWRLPYFGEFDESIPFPSHLFDYHEINKFPYSGIPREVSEKYNNFVIISYVEDYSRNYCTKYFLSTLILCKEADF